MVKGRISASMMCASLDKIFYYLTEFKKNKVEFLHIDIMDGEFVKNFALGTDFVKNLRRYTDIPFDFHFLVNNPLEKMTWFDVREGDRVAFHYEGNEQIIGDCLDYLYKKGATRLIAINPETDYRVLDDYLSELDGALLMTIEPGFLGKKLIPYTIDKTERFVKHVRELGYTEFDVEVDGNITVENAKKLYDRGATTFVAGTSSIFRASERNMDELIAEKRSVIGW